MLNLEYEIQREKNASLVTDSIGKAILSKIITTKSIRISDLPLDRNPSILTLDRLYKYEKMNLLESKFENNGNKYERVFYPSDRLMKIINIILTP